MMNKYLATAFVFSSVTFYGQKVIAEVPFSNENVPVQTIYLPNLDHLVIQSGERTNKVYGNIIKDISSYDTDGFVEKMVANEKLVNCVFSPIENAFLIAKLPTANKYPEEYKLVLDGRPSKYFKLQTGFRYFNDIYGFNVLNQKDDFRIDLQKDDLFLNVVDIFSDDSQKFKLEKPDLFRLENKVTTAYQEGINFDVRINEANIGIVTKSINKNYKSTTLYRTSYDLTGKRLQDVAYTIFVPKNFLIYSNNGGGIINRTGDDIQVSDLAINNFIVDKTTEDVYVYGLYGNEGKASNNLKNVPLGIYVFKFDKDGKLIWESINEMVDILGFNQLQELNAINLNLKLRKDNLLVSVHSFNNNGYLDFLNLDILNGAKIAEGKVSGLTRVSKNKDTHFVKSPMQIKDLVNKNVDYETIIAAQLHPKLMWYLKNEKTNTVLFYNTFVSKKGYWVLETDNASFYKILFFD